MQYRERDLRGQPGGQILLDPHREYDHVRIWRWEHAPPHLKELSEHGGDEEGIVWIPNKYLSKVEDGGIVPYWLEALWMTFGNFQDFIRLHDGVLVIWAHA